MFSIINKIDQSTIDEIVSIGKLAHLKEDVSSYAKGRCRTWLNMHWDLKNRIFDKNECLRNPRLWEIMLSIWPEAQIGLLTYSGKTDPKGISLHRDDSYADYESVGIQLTGTCLFEYMGGYRHFHWHADKDTEEKKTFNLKPGDVFRFNCKNRHSAIPSVDRYAINLWKVSPKFKKEYDEASQPTIKPLF
jgi:hypothetical protein